MSEWRREGHIFHLDGMCRRKESSGYREILNVRLDPVLVGCTDGDLPYWVTVETGITNGTLFSGECIKRRGSVFAVLEDLSAPDTEHLELLLMADVKGA